MTNSTVPPEAVPRYGFSIYKGGVLVREQVVPAATAAIAEVKVHRYLEDGEYPGCVVPRQIKDEDSGIVQGHGNDGDDADADADDHDEDEALS